MGENSALIFAFEPAPSPHAALSVVHVADPLSFEVSETALAGRPAHAQFEVTGERSDSLAIMTGEEKTKAQSEVITENVSMVDAMAFAANHGDLVGQLMEKEIKRYWVWHPELKRFFLANFVMLRPAVAQKLPTREMTFNTSNVTTPQ